MRSSAWLLILTGLALAGCPASVQPRPEDGPATAADLLPALDAYLASGPASLYLEGRASQYSDSGALKGKLEILLDRQRGFRLSGLTPTDDVVSTIASNTERFAAFERGRKVCYTGPACPANVARFASIPMAPTELAGVLMGRPPFKRSEDGAVGLDWDAKAGAWTLTAVTTSSEQTVWFTAKSPRVVRTRVIRHGSLVADVRYSDFKRVGDSAMPQRIDMKLARDDTDLRIDIRDFDTEVALGDDAFTFECPAGVTVEELPCE